MVGTSTTAMPLGLSETKARRLSARNTAQTGALPVATPMLRLAPSDQVRLASPTRSSRSVLVLMMDTTAVAPPAATLTCQASVGPTPPLATPQPGVRTHT